MKKISALAFALILLLTTMTAIAKDNLVVHCSDTPAKCQQLVNALSTKYIVRLVNTAPQSNSPANTAAPNMVTTIQCPICRNPIPIDTTELIQGKAFSCAICRAVISLAPESTTSAREAYKKFQSLKK
ncbi:hypothetical protein [Maridesulfovibrio sp.]|uniref:hypothetical protein n=1 Tax=Maridesulfovibrio sp. TaxID=2795000 RepID=UPI003BA9910B